MAKNKDYASLRDGGQSAHDFRAFVERLEDHLDDPAYQWAFDTLSGIHDDVINATRFTDAQEEAVSNIEAAVNRRDRR